MIEIGKEQDGKLEAGLLGGEVGFGESALALLDLDLGLDYIHMRYFAAALAILTDGEVFLGVGEGALGGGLLVLGGEEGVIIRGDGGGEAAEGDLGLGAGERLAGLGLAQGGEGAEVEGFVQIALAEVFVDGVVGDEAEALGVDVAVVVAERGEEGGAGLGVLGGGDVLGGEGGGEIGAVGAGTGLGGRQRQSGRRGRLSKQGAGGEERERTEEAAHGKGQVSSEQQ